MVKSGVQKARAQDVGSKLKFLERAAKRRKKRVVGRSQSGRRGRRPQVECREAKVSTKKKRACGKKRRTQRKRGKTPTGFVNQKNSRHAFGLITNEGEEEGRV